MPQTHLLCYLGKAFTACHSADYAKEQQRVAGKTYYEAYGAALVFKPMNTVGRARAVVAMAPAGYQFAGKAAVWRLQMIRMHAWLCPHNPQGLHDCDSWHSDFGASPTHRAAAFPQIIDCNCSKMSQSRLCEACLMCANNLCKSG